MPPPPLPPALSEFLSAPNPSVIATLRPDGGPHSAATWYLWEDGRVLVNMDEGRKRLEHLRRDAQVSLTVLGADSWYRHVTLLGRVAVLEPDTDRSSVPPLHGSAVFRARSRTGERLDRGRVVARLERRPAVDRLVRGAAIGVTR
jgi:PPOX class probable F420-dependent enzyme